ncbi:MAG: M28 family peptidase [Bacteroidales bacterium]|jgi:hypothetical protein
MKISKTFKSLLFVIFLVICNNTFAKDLIFIELNKDDSFYNYINKENLQINYYNDMFIVCTVDDYNCIKNSSFEVIDNDAWGNFEYVLLNIFKDNQGNQDKYINNYNGNGNIIYSNDYFIIVKIEKDTDIIFEKVNYRGIVRLRDKQAEININSGVNLKGYSALFDQDIADLVDKVNADSLEYYVQHLQDYGTRRYNSPQAVEAQNWIKEHFERYGFDVELQDVEDYNSKNVIAVKQGSKIPDEYVVCGSHYDSFTYWGAAPGADDNATGTAGMMEIARIISEYDFDRSIVICTFTAEEIGLVGSDAYATRCAEQNMNILGYFNIDMSGYLAPGNQMKTSVICPSSANDLYEFYKSNVEIYVPQLEVEKGSLWGGDSDHTSFNENGYVGIYPFENANNYSPYIHTIGDTIGTSVNNFEQVKTFTQACLANVLTLTKFKTSPINLTAKSYDGEVVLNWNEISDDEFLYYRIYRDDMIIDSTETNSYIDKNVINNTLYTYYITSIYSNNYESNPSNSVEAYPMASLIPPFIENWDSTSNLPDGWMLFQEFGEDKWVHSKEGVPEPYSEEYLVRMYSPDKSICKLITPKLNLSDFENLELTFMHAQRALNGANDELRVYYKNDEYNEWQLIEEYTENTPEWTLRTIELPNLSDNYYIAFEGETKYGYSVELDDIMILDPSGIDILNNDVTIYPNPSDGICKINQKVKNIEVYNSLGSIIDAKITYSNNKTIINLQNCKKGLYIIKFEIDNKVKFAKVIKK